MLYVTGDTHGNINRFSAKELKKLKEQCTDIVAKAEAQGDIPSREEARRRMKVWNDINNEGGEGFVPRIICREEYEAAKEFLSTH